MSKSIKSFRLEDNLITELEKEAKENNRTTSNYVEHLLLTHPARGGSKNKKNKKAKNGI